MRSLLSPSIVQGRAQPPATAAHAADVVFLLDVDNTLLDNDRVIAELHEHLQREFGPRCAQRYWTIFEQLRAELGYADYLGALQRYRLAITQQVGGPELLTFVATDPTFFTPPRPRRKPSTRFGDKL